MPSARSLVPRRPSAVLVLCALLLAGGPAPASAATPRYLDQERYALSLLNCTRTGGWVTDAGRCKGRGSGKHSSYRKPLDRHRGIADDVARPYARKLARYDQYTHEFRSTIDQRFRRAGYTSSTNGESLGWSSGLRVREMVISISRLFQSERGSNGWHWRNLKNRDFHHVGIGIAVIDGEKRIVFDFYR